MNDTQKSTWGGSLISRRRMLHYGLAGIVGTVGGFWPLSALGETHLMSSTKTGDRSFDTLEYHTLNGSWRYSSITIHKNYIGEYICFDNIYDDKKYPGHSSGKLPDTLVKNIESNIDSFTIISEQKIDNPLRQHYSLFNITVNNNTVVQPEPDMQHEYMLPQYAKISDSFIKCIEYLKSNGDRFFLSTQAILEIDYQNRPLFTFSVENTGAITGKIKNFIEQNELASTYSTEKGPGPLFGPSDCTIVNANFDVAQPELELPPNAPLIITMKSKVPMPMGEWAFTLGLSAIHEVPVAGGEVRTYNFQTSLVTVTLN